MTKRSSAKQHGLTLIELLVTMVLLGFVVALMSGAFVQIAQMLRISSEYGNGFAGRWVPTRTLQNIVANISQDPNETSPLLGAAERVIFSTLALPPNYNGIVQRATLELKRSNYVAGTETQSTLQLLQSNPNAPTDQSKPQELAVFNGRLIFIYLDAQGKEFRQWPPQGTTQTDTLPSAIGLRDEADQGKIVQLAYYEGETTSKRSSGAGLMLWLQR